MCTVVLPDVASGFTHHGRIAIDRIQRRQSHDSDVAMTMKVSGLTTGNFCQVKHVFKCHSADASLFTWENSRTAGKNKQPL